MNHIKINNGASPSISNYCTDKDFILDFNQRELTQHGTEEFPCRFYLDKNKNSSYPWHWHDEIELAFVHYVYNFEVTA